MSKWTDEAIFDLRNRVETLYDHLGLKFIKITTDKYWGEFYEYQAVPKETGKHGKKETE